MAVICPTVTPGNDPHEFRMQLERIVPFSERIHLDFMDGVFTTNESLPLDRAWTPEGKQVDLHLMYMRPDIYLDQIMRLHPSLVIVHAEAKIDISKFAASLRAIDISFGVCLLKDTPVSVLSENISEIDHVLVFSGNLGHFGGHADISLLDRVKQLKDLKPELEVGWDGGINDQNAAQLVKGGVDVLNVGGFIQKSNDPKSQYDKLVSVTTP